MKEKKSEKNPCKFHCRDLNLHPGPTSSSGKSEASDHLAMRLLWNYYPLPFTLFESCGTVFIMNSKIQLRKNSLANISKSFCIIFPCLFTLGLYNSRSMNAIIITALAEVQVAILLVSSTARISSHLSNQALCLQPAVVCLRNTLRFANLQLYRT